MPTASLPGIGASIRMRAGGQGHRQVVGEGLDPADLDVGAGLDLVLGHDRAGVAADDLGRDREAAQLLLDPARVRRVVDRRVRAPGRGHLEELDRRQRPVDRLEALEGRRLAIVGQHGGRPGRRGDADRRLRPRGRSTGAGGTPSPPPVQTVWLIGAGPVLAAGSSRMLDAAAAAATPVTSGEGATALPRVHDRDAGALVGRLRLAVLRRRGSSPGSRWSEALVVAPTQPAVFVDRMEELLQLDVEGQHQPDRERSRGR